MLTEMDDKVLEAELCTDMLPNMADAGADAAYEAGMWHHL